MPCGLFGDVHFEAVVGWSLTVALAVRSMGEMLRFWCTAWRACFSQGTLAVFDDEAVTASNASEAFLSS